MKKNLVKICSVSLSVILLMFLFTMCKGDKNKKEDMNKVFKEFVANLEAKVIPLHKESALAYFNAAISGKEEDFAKSAEFEIQMSKIFANKEDFATLKKIKESGQVTDELLARQLDVLYNAYLGNQIDEKKLEEMIQLQTEIEKKYNNFRAIVGKDSLTDNQIEEVLSTSTDTRKLKDVWMAHKKIGSLVADDIKKLVKMRNEAAVSLGFKNYHEMSLKLSEQDPTEIEKLFDELDNLTANVFVQLKSEIDEYLAKRYKIKKEELMPWHYQNRFFQEAPKIYTLDLDKYYKNKDVVELTKNYYASIGLPIDDMLAKSDLFEKPGKNQHAFCIDIDKQGDVRVLCNIKNNSMWMNTMLHEFGHAIYDKHIDINLPFFLRDPAHTFTTEAIAMMFGRMYSNPAWIKDNVGISEQEKQKISEESRKILKLEQIVFSRWAQVMYRFEKSMYENPDQDLNKLWWDLVEKYQLLKRPEGRNEPDWASKIHIASSPCYYHNYLLGELLASQLNNYIVKNIIKADNIYEQSFTGNKEVGKYLIEKVFAPGSRYHWNVMIEQATGEKLTPKYYAEQFVN